MLQYWALQASPKKYDIWCALSRSEYDWWRIYNSDVRKGDRFIVWQSLDSKKNRGVVALAVAVGDPIENSIAELYEPKEHSPCWVGPAGDIHKKNRRIRIRYIKIPEPLWVGDSEISHVLESLTVCGNQGGIFRVTEDQARLIIQCTGLDKTYFMKSISEDEKELEEKVYQLIKSDEIDEDYQGSDSAPKKTERRTQSFKRDPVVKANVIRVANGICELCNAKAPFLDKMGMPFLEVHHVVPLAEGGKDQTTNAVALCPNCHRRCHHSRDAKESTEKLYAQVGRLVKSLP